MARWLALVGMSLVACTRASTPMVTATPDPPATTRVHAYGLAFGDVDAVKASTTGRVLPFERDAQGCIAFVADRSSQTFVDVRAGEARAVVWIPPVPGDVELMLARTPALHFAVASHDDASRVVAVQNEYLQELRGRDAPRSREAASGVRTKIAAARSQREREAWSLVGYVLARAPKAEPDPGDRDAAIAFICTLPADHWAWSIEWEAIVLATSNGDVAVSLAEQVASVHADPDVRAAAGWALVDHAQRGGDLSQIRRALTRLRSDVPASKAVFARPALTYDPDRGLREGEPVPFVSLAAAEHDAPLELASLRGRVVVLHFWSTWCGGCKEGVAGLERLFATHRGDPLTIVSVAFDEEWSAVTRFRAEHSPMPWTHARLRGESVEELIQRFEITSSTKTLLIGKDGALLAEQRHPGEDGFAALVAAALAR